MAKVIAVMIDSREPDWARRLSFGDNIIVSGRPENPVALDAGDYHLFRDDGDIVAIERKEAGDFLNSMRGEGNHNIKMQMQKLSEMDTKWKYLLITGGMVNTKDGHVMTERRVTGWQSSSVDGMLLSIQEMGIAVAYGSDSTLADDLRRIAERSHDAVKVAPSTRDISLLSPEAAFLAGIPGIGEKRAIELLKKADNNPLHALMWLMDLYTKDKSWDSIKRKAKAFMQSPENQTLEIMNHE